MTFPLRQNELHVWLAHRSSSGIPDLDATLSEEELNRARRFHFERDSLAYRFAHSVLRNVVGKYVDLPPGEIRFDNGPLGKPFLRRTQSDGALQFNLSHSDQMVVVGLCRDHRIGIDVEHIRPLDEISDIVKSHFTKKEADHIFSQSRGDQLRAFYSCWTRKEAYIKAVGKGLSIPLNSFHISPTWPGQGTFGVEGLPPTDRAVWQLCDLSLPPGYVGAIAVDTHIEQLLQFHW